VPNTCTVHLQKQSIAPIRNQLKCGDTSDQGERGVWCNVPRLCCVYVGAVITTITTRYVHACERTHSYVIDGDSQDGSLRAQAKARALLPPASTETKHSSTREAARGAIREKHRKMSHGWHLWLIHLLSIHLCV